MSRYHLAALLVSIVCLLSVAPLVHGSTVASGFGHTCAVTPSGGVRCMGDNNYGQLGDGTTTSRLIPTDVMGLRSGVVAVAAGNFHTCALLANSEVWCWGANSQGQLGAANGQSQSAPAYVGADAIKIAANAAHTCAVLTTGQVECWGLNADGQIGDGTTTNRLSPVP